MLKRHREMGHTEQLEIRKGAHGQHVTTQPYQKEQHMSQLKEPTYPQVRHMLNQPPKSHIVGQKATPQTENSYLPTLSQPGRTHPYSRKHIPSVRGVSEDGRRAPRQGTIARFSQPFQHSGRSGVSAVTETSPEKWEEYVDGVLESPSNTSTVTTPPEANMEQGEDWDENQDEQWPTEEEIQEWRDQEERERGRETVPTSDVEIVEPTKEDNIDGVMEGSQRSSRPIENVNKGPVNDSVKTTMQTSEKTGPSTSSGTHETIPLKGVGETKEKSIMLTPYVPATFPLVMLHLGQGRYLSAGYVDGAYDIRIQDNYPKKYDNERRRCIKLNKLQFLDLLAVMPNITGELHRLQTAKQTSVNEEDKRHIGSNVYCSIFRSTEDNLFVDIRQFFIPDEEVAKGVVKLIPTKKGISLRVQEWEQLTKLATHIKLYIPGLRSTERCSVTHTYQADRETCSHCSPNWLMK
jgi:hypothetical protein